MSSPAAHARATQWAEQHADALWRFAMSRLNSRELAEEAVQETFLAAVRSADSFQEQSAPLTWLTGILIHKIADIHRARAKGGKAAALDDLDTPAASGTFTKGGKWSVLPASWGIDPQSPTDLAKVREALRTCLDKLPENLRTPVEMRDVLAVPSEEVCKQLQITATNLWTRLHRARALLRTCVERSITQRP